MVARTTKVSNMTDDAVAIQRAYYAATAQSYDGAHDAYEENHGYSLAEQFMLSAAQFLNIQSILDIGAGTGRVLLKINKEMPDLDAIGIEPSPELRSVGYANGLSPARLRDGDATCLAFDEGSFDLVCEFGVLHHIAAPSRAVSEMLRVARKAIFIVDNNNFAVGSNYARMLKQSIAAVGLWRLAVLIKTKGKGYSITAEDGLAYPYSAFDDYDQIAKNCRSVHMLNTTVAGPNLYRSAPRVALLGIKR
jgi:ubiquinone/menaquinone biosynthesis C-methylase UbiE